MGPRRFQAVVSMQSDNDRFGANLMSHDDRDSSTRVRDCDSTCVCVCCSLLYLILTTDEGGTRAREAAGVARRCMPCSWELMGAAHFLVIYSVVDGRQSWR
jgi:hypothetical protein